MEFESLERILKEGWKERISWNGYSKYYCKHTSTGFIKANSINEAENINKNMEYFDFNDEQKIADLLNNPKVSKDDKDKLITATPDKMKSLIKRIYQDLNYNENW